MSASSGRAYLAPGARLEERFEIVERLGAGSFGEVYRARQLVFGKPFRTVALKLFKSAVVDAANADVILADVLALAALLEESPPLEVASRLVQLYDIGVVRAPEERAFLSMQLVSGKATLDDLVRKYAQHGMPVALTLHYVREVAIALAWMHALDNPMVHGDLKPDNVLLTPDRNRVVLTDFGLAARLPLGAIGGALTYMAPEVLLGAPGHAQADVYSLGVVWYEMLTGRHPFAEVGLEAQAAADPQAALRAHQQARRAALAPWSDSREPSPDRIAAPEASNVELREHPQVASMLRRCMAHQVGDRYANAGQLLRDIEAYLSGGAIAGLEQPQPDPTLRAPAAARPERKLADARALLSRGEAESALRLLADDPFDGSLVLEALLLRGRAELHCGRVDRARAACDRAMRLDPRRAEVFDLAADLYEAQSQFTLAAGMRTRSQALRRSPSGSQR